MSVLASHYNGDLQYNTHQLYALGEIKATAEAAQAIRGTRPFVLSRHAELGRAPRAGAQYSRGPR